MRKKFGNVKILLFTVIFSIGNILSAQVLNSTVAPVEWSYDKTIYEVNIRQYSEEGTFDAFKEHLPRLKELGVGILWLMPIHPIGEENRKGTMGSYYSVKDYFGINPSFGDEESFRSLVKAAHDHGMYVIIDWVANHTAWDNPLTNEHPEFYTRDSLGNFVPPIADWSDVIDLDYSNKKLWEYMIGALKYWVEEFNIDGYRCDVAAMVPTEFWNEARKELDKIKPVFMLAEAWEPELHEHAFDMTYAWDFHHLFNNIAQGEKDGSDFKKLYKKEKRVYPPNAFRMQFTSNHDENSWNGTVFERLGATAETFAALTFAMEGMPLIYNGQEVGMNKRLNFFEKDLIEWKDHPFEELYTNLIRMKKENKALWNGEKGGDMQFIGDIPDQKIIAFVREKEGNKVLSIFNLSPVERSITLDKLAADGYIEYFSKENKVFHEGDIVTLQPWKYKIYVK